MEPALSAMDQETRNLIAVHARGQACMKANAGDAKEPAFTRLLPSHASNAVEAANMARRYAKNALDQASINLRSTFLATDVKGQVVIQQDAEVAMERVRSLWNVINAGGQAGIDINLNRS